MRKRLKSVGERYEAKYFLSELMFASALMSDVLEILKLHMTLDKIQ